MPEMMKTHLFEMSPSLSPFFRPSSGSVFAQMVLICPFLGLESATLFLEIQSFETQIASETLQVADPNLFQYFSKAKYVSVFHPDCFISSLFLWN